MVERNRIPTVLLDTTLNDARQLLEKQSHAYESIDYIYVIDRSRHLRGVFSLKELFSHSKKGECVNDIMQENLITLRPHTHQERVALLALEHKVEAIPVVDKGNVLLGVVVNDAILRILHSEAMEDILRFGGVLHSGPHDDVLKLSILTSLKHRLPWLMLGLFGGIIAAGVVGLFEKVISQNVILAAFIPLIVYMADAVGTQMEAYMIRDLAVNQKLRFMKYFARQAMIILLIGVAVSAILYALSLILYRNPLVSLVLGVALFVAILSSLFIGLTFPYIFSKLKLDPANASGPVATIIQDVLSVLVFFSIATWIL